MAKIAFIVFTFFLISCGSEKRDAVKTKSTQGVEQKDSHEEKAVRETVKQFLNWYKNNYQSLAAINFTSKVKVDKQEYFIIEFDNVRQFIEKLRASGCLSDSYLENLDQYFKDCNKSLIEEKIEEGAIDCLNYDLILNTQEIDASLSKIPNANAFNTVLKRDSAYADIELAYKLRFTLSKYLSSWKIDKIEVLPEAGK